MLPNNNISLLQLREALEASWSSDTSYLGVWDSNNPALGQCYPTSRVVQHFFPKTEIVKGEVWNGKELHIHFWNRLQVSETVYDIDLSWQQFPHGSFVKKSEVLDRDKLGDSDKTIKRCDLLLQKVTKEIELNKKD